MHDRAHKTGTSANRCTYTKTWQNTGTPGKDCVGNNRKMPAARSGNRTLQLDVRLFHDTLSIACRCTMFYTNPSKHGKQNHPAVQSVVLLPISGCRLVVVLASSSSTKIPAVKSDIAGTENFISKIANHTLTTTAYRPTDIRDITDDETVVQPWPRLATGRRVVTRRRKSGLGTASERDMWRPEEPQGRSPATCEQEPAPKPKTSKGKPSQPNSNGPVMYNFEEPHEHRASGLTDDAHGVAEQGAARLWLSWEFPRRCDDVYQGCRRIGRSGHRCGPLVGDSPVSPSVVAPAGESLACRALRMPRFVSDHLERCQDHSSRRDEVPMVHRFHHLLALGMHNGIPTGR